MQVKRTPRRGPARGKGRAALSAQQTIPYLEMLKDGVCRVRDGYYTKTIAYEDINYSVASTEDQAAIFSGWCSFLNYFDSALPFQLSFVNHRSRGGGRCKVNIPMAHDEFDSIRGEYVDMLKRQIARSNNGIVRSKYITFGAPADNLAAARPRLERVEADIMGNFKRLGVQSHVLNGWERLEALHGQLHPGGREPFRFSWGDIPKTGMGTKDFIVPDSFDFTQGRTFRVGQSWGAASFLQIMASELSDKLLLELLELDAEMTVTLHVQTVDQTKAIKTVKGKISDIDKMKVEEQRKATRSGYDPDILPPDLITYAKDAAALLADLQSRNERMFLLTFLVVNTAPTRERLENEVFTVSGIAQKHNCTLRRLDYQQEQGYMSSLPLGWNGIEIQRGMTTSSTAIFIPFMTKELRMDGQALYYGMNALSNNVIMADRKRLKNPNGMFLGTPGSGKSFAAKREIVNVFLTWPEARRVASALELYCTGSLNLFNHRTNVEVSNRLLCYDIKALGKMLKKIGLLILTDQVWGRVTANREKRRATWVYQDEFHVLLADPQTAAYSVEIFRRFRKWGAIPSGITQNVKSLLESSEIESIFGNCDFLYLLSQAAGDREVLASHLGISPHQLSYVTHSGSGEGLLFYGDTAIPFVDRFPKDTELYTLLTTKPEDKANERKDE